MAEREDCGTCAFREGCVTNTDEPHNLLRGLVAAFSGLPFYCHYDREGKDRSSVSIRGLTAETALALRKEMRICEGWRKKVAELARAGNFQGEAAKVRRWAGIYALQKINEFIDGEEGSEEKEKAIRELGHACELLGIADRGEDRTPA